MSRDWTQHPPGIYPDYKSSVKRGPTQAPLDLLALYAEAAMGAPAELSGSLCSRHSVSAIDQDLTRNAVADGPPLGERIVVSGRVLDEFGRPVRGALVEIWQANSCGRYVHKTDQHDAPLDPNFLGAGRAVTDSEGAYRFYTIKPGAYPWANHDNAWRPAHIHFSLSGPELVSRLVTQMYFPGDPLLELDPIFGAVPAAGRPRLISGFDLGLTEAGFALGYRFDIVLRGSQATPSDPDHD